MAAISPADPIVIVGAARTPIGGFLGALADVAAPDLGARAIAAAVARAGVDGAAVERVTMGCVLPAGLGQAPARQAALKAGLPDAAQATTLNKVCGSGMQAAIVSAEALAAGSVDLVVAGGMESMSNAPYLLAKHRRGARAGHDTTYDHMFLDGLEDAYEPGRAMGSCAQASADGYQLTRAAQDAYALESLTRARAAIAGGGFADEIAPVSVTSRRGETLVDTDEAPGKAQPERIPQLKAAFAAEGTITAASSSSISDGAAALVLTRASVAAAHGLVPLARVVGAAAHAQAPATFASAPVGAITRLLAQVGWRADEVELWEINEAFACVPMIAMHDLGLAPARVNVNGGATALGHPIGASGARIIVTLLAALRARGLSRGVASLCIGGGEATALAVETL